MAPKNKRPTSGVEAAGKPSQRIEVRDKLYHAIELPDGRIISGGVEEFIFATDPSPTGKTVSYDNPRNNDGEPTLPCRAICFRRTPFFFPFRSGAAQSLTHASAR